MNAGPATSLEQRTALLQGEVSSRELLAHALDRAEEVGELGAFVSLNPELALAEADECDGQISATPAAERHQLPPLLGLPTAHKDLVNVRGVATTHGSRAVPHSPAESDDPVVAAVRKAGAISIGKTQVPEFGIAGYSENDVAPPARNPHNSALTAGGSSGGTAAAIASRVFPAAIGSDAGGSIRIPSGACGLVGLKPGRGRVPADVASVIKPDPIGAPQLGVSGPMARTADDAALWFDALLGDPQGTSLSAVGRAGRVSGLRIGVSLDSPFESWFPVTFTDEAHAAVAAAVSRLEAHGHVVEEASIDYGQSYPEAFTTVWTQALTRLGLAEDAQSRLGELATMFLEQAREKTSDEVEAAVKALGEFAHSALRQWGSYDAILSPALSGPPPAIGEFRARGPEGDYQLQCEWAPQTSMVNVVGTPAVVCPAPGVVVEGRPVGIQLIGRMGAEVTLLQLAAQLTS